MESGSFVPLVQGSRSYRLCHHVEEGFGLPNLGEIDRELSESERYDCMTGVVRKPQKYVTFSCSTNES